MERVKIGVLGTGNRGYGMLKLLSAHPGYEVVAIGDCHSPRLAAARELMRDDEIGFAGESYSRLDRFLAHPGMMAVYVATPDNAHVNPCLKALAKGLHVLCEKPLATTLADCRKIAAAARSSKATFYLGFNLRHLPVYVRAQEMVAAGRLGRIHLVRGAEFYYGGATYFQRWNRFERYGGGMFITKLSHDFDLLAFVTGQRVRRVAAFGGLSVFRPDRAEDAEREYAPYRGLLGESRHRLMSVGGTVDGADTDVNLYTSQKDTVDNAVILLDFMDDLRGTYDFCTFNSRGRDGRELEIIGDRGHLWLTANPQRLVFHERHSQKSSIEEFNTTGGHGGADEIQLDSFHRCLVHGEKPRAEWHDGLASVQVGLAVRQACASGRVVTVKYD